MTALPHRPKFWWLWPILFGVLGFVIVHPFDGPLSHAAARLEQSLGGDLRREVHAWQQFGQGLCLIVTAGLIWQLDPTRRRRLLDLLLVVGVAQATSTLGKLFIGRPRPRPQFEDPHTFLFPWGTYPITVGGGGGGTGGGEQRLVHAWDTAAGANTDLWSMPSSHTLFAFALAVYLGVRYPPIRWIVGVLAIIVGIARVLFDAHWPTDAIVGAAAGWLIAEWITRGYLGVRLLDTIWTRLVDRSAKPALEAQIAAEAALKNRR